MNIKEMTPVKVAIYRCGTSKAIFIHKNDLPKDRETRTGSFFPSSAALIRGR